MEENQRKSLIKKLRIGLLSILCLIGIIAVLTILVINCYPNRWLKEVALIKQLSPSPIFFNIKYPSSSMYGYKYIILDASKVDSSLLNKEINISIKNMNKHSINFSSKGFYSGSVGSEQSATLFKGKLIDMMKFYNSNSLSQLPNISHNNKDRYIMIIISTNERIIFSEPIRLYTFADFDFSI